MKIAMVSWEIIEMGGINRLLIGFKDGFEKLGHKVMHVRPSRNGRLKLDSKEWLKSGKDFRAPAHNLGYATEDGRKLYDKVAKWADFIFFIHPCIHPTKANKDDRDWQYLYQTDTPIGVLFTDNLWDKFYPWIEEVKDNITTCFFNNWNAQFDSLAKFEHRFKFLHYPMSFENLMHNKRRSIDVAWIPQWKKWKGIWDFVRSLSLKPDRFSTVLFNAGIEYYYMRKEPFFKQAINQDMFTGEYHNEDSLVTYYGMVSPDKMDYVYAKSIASVDLSGMRAKKFEAQVTCTMIEAMVQKSIPIVAPQINTDDRSLLKGMDLTWPVDPDNIVDSIEEILKNEKKRKIMAKRGFEYAYEHNKDTEVAQSVIDGVMSPPKWKKKLPIFV